MSPVFNKIDMLRLLVWGAPMNAPNAFDYFALVPTLNVAFSLLHYLFHPEFTWFSPWPLLQALVLLLSIPVLTACSHQDTPAFGASQLVPTASAWRTAPASRLPSTPSRMEPPSQASLVLRGRHAAASPAQSRPSFDCV